jgi:hypothetical protein
MDTEHDRIITAVALWCCIKASEGYSAVWIGGKGSQPDGVLNKDMSYREVGRKVEARMWSAYTEESQNDLMLVLANKYPYPNKQTYLRRGRIEELIKIDKGW